MKRLFETGEAESTTGFAPDAVVGDKRKLSRFDQSRRGISDTTFQRVWSE